MKCSPPSPLPSQVMGKNKVLVKVHPEGKYVVDLDKAIDINDIKAGARVALRNDSYTLHLVLPTKVDPLVSLMKVEKVPDSTYDMIGGAEQQIKEIKEVGGCKRHAGIYLMSVGSTLTGVGQLLRTSLPQIIVSCKCSGNWVCVKHTSLPT